MVISEKGLKVFSFPCLSKVTGAGSIYTFAINPCTLEYNYGCDSLEIMLRQDCWEAQEYDSLKAIVESVLNQAIVTQAPEG